MKKVMLLLGLVISIASCKGNKEQEVTILKEEAVKLQTSKRIEQLYSEMLVPMEVVNAEADVVTKKYGLEFGGNCYACDVAQLIVDGEMINLLNACDMQTQISFKITKVEEKDKIIEVHTPFNVFSFERVDDYPMFRLQVSGQGIDQTLYRPAIYYTLKSRLDTFEVHDCGDFEG
ncbi:hypothetical protein [Myroides pelagicus]|uniref:Lipoprotein n=1 Tax=Myroides pelagicus TaxID=270914 RepID=A0A7K1GPF8_9FLAO|nr:hypothetical protein [Myroides pelagicus]MEC4114646.1 hypothetical protein [Myroides pelagicus]MTH30726.1 hypothetical protein [Myroides pelagicus]